MKIKALFSVIVLVGLFLPGVLFFSPQKANADITTGLVGYWKFDEGSGSTAQDTVSVPHNGTLTNGPLWAAGKVNNALQFNTTDNGNDSDDPRVIVGTSFNVSLPLTISAWVNPTDYNDYRTIFSKRSSWSASGMRFDWTLNSGSGKVFVGRNGSTRTFNYNPPTNTWTHLSLVLTSSAAVLYVNGVQSQSLGAISLGTGNTANTVIGGNGEPLAGGDNDPFKGKIDEVRVYNRALSGPEIVEAFNDIGGPDTVAPSVPSGLTATAVSASQINLAWNASSDNVAVAGYKIFRDSVQVATTTSTSFVNTGLSSSTAYSFNVSSYDAAGNNSAQSPAAGATTFAPPDTTAPLISAVFENGITQNGATINWTTDEPSDTQIQYGITTSYGSQTTLNSSLVTSHTQNLSGLAASTTYNYRVVSKDAAGNLAVSSNFSFTTSAPAPDTQAPSVPSGLTATAVSTSQINLTWNASTDNVAVAGYRIFRDGFQIATSTPISFSNTGLSQSTSYAYTVASFDAAGNQSLQSSIASATTFSPDTTPPVISAVSASAITQNSANITWTTNETADSQVEYGLTTSYGLQTSLNSSLVTSHLQSLAGLSASTTYNYRVISKDAAGNLTSSTNFTFITSALPPPDAVFVQNICGENGSSALVSSVSASLNNVTAGNLIVVWAKHEGTATTMTVTDGTSSFTPATKISHVNTDLHGQFFYLLSANGGNKTYTLNFSAARKYATIMVWEYSPSGGMVSFDAQSTNTGTGTAMTSGNVSTTGTNEVSVVGYGEYSVYSPNTPQVNGLAATHILSATSGCVGAQGNYTRSWDRIFNSSFTGQSTATLSGSSAWILNLVAFKVSPAVPDTTGPVISSVSASGITQTSADISWTTDETADSQIEYGLTTGYGLQTTLNASLVTAHSQTLTGLSPNTTYNYRVKSKDQAQNFTVSGNFSFTTSSPPPPDTQAPSTPTNLVATAVSQSQINLTWTASTDNVAVTGYKILRNGSEIATTTLTSFANTGLSPSTNYYYNVLAYDAANNFSQQSFVVSATTQDPDVTPPIISNATSTNVGSSQVTISWNTDEASNSQIDYGTTTDYGSQTSLDTSLVTSHSQTIFGLSPNTTYNYRINSRDAVGNLSISANYTFTTSPPGTYGLEWLGNLNTQHHLLYWNNPFPIYDATYIFKVYPRQKTYSCDPALYQSKYYTTFFWGNNGRFEWQGGGSYADTYYGAHPYARPAPCGEGEWEISVASQDITPLGQKVQWNRWFTQAFRAWRDPANPDITHHEFYYDLPDTTKVITHDVNSPTWAKQNPPNPAIVVGQAPDRCGPPPGNCNASWGGYQGWEEFNGIIRGIQMYSNDLSVSDILSEINSPKSTTAGLNSIWYLNTDPRPTDVTDKKGVGTPHNPLWEGAAALEWTLP